MKSRRRFIIFMLVFGIVLLVLLLITIFSLLKLLIFKEVKIDNRRKIEEKYPLSDIDNVSFDFKRADVVFKTTNDNELSIIQNNKEEKLYLNINKSSRQLIIDEISNIFDNKNIRYTIKIPKSYLGNISIVNGFGKISIYNMDVNSYIDNNAGEINMYKSKNITIKDVSGQINLNDISGLIKLSSSTGNINIKTIKGILEIDTLTGDVNVNNFKIEGDSKIDNISGNIIMSINKDSLCKIKSENQNGETNINKKICGDKKNILKVSNVTGKINIK